MQRTALARQYRPRRFSEIAMQDHVSETLKAAVARGRVAHAYLFSGPRGVGKTTAARVLAMALNCPNRTTEGEPCGECDSCTRIWSGKTSLDVVEIDAASNRGVDDARDLRERAMYAPTEEGRFKVYIIDEAHMLTREAWNALLKILEEPPPRVIFVFATTEPQKIQQAAPPILSRCQRFDFRRIGVHGIVDRLREVLSREGVEVSDDALLPIARRADGGMRDSLSLLDQVLAFVGDRAVTAEDVIQVLGLVEEERYLELFGILAERRHADVFRFVERLLDDGYDLAEFYRGLADALRTLMIVKLDGVEAADVREDLRDLYAERAAAFGIGDLVRMLAQAAELDTDGRFRKTGSPRILLEAMLLRFAHLERTVELEALVRAVGQDSGGGSRESGGGDPGPGGSGGGEAVPSGGGVEYFREQVRRLRETGATPTSGARGAADTDPPRGAAVAKPETMVARPEAVAAPSEAVAARPEAVAGQPEAVSAQPATMVARSEAAVAVAEPVPEPVMMESATVAPAPESEVMEPARDAPVMEPRERAPEDEPEVAPAVAPNEAAPVDPAAAFQAVLESGEGVPVGLGVFLRAGRVAAGEGGVVVLELPPGPGLERLSGDSPARVTLRKALSDRMGRPIELEVRAWVAEAGADGGLAIPPRLTPEQVKADRLRRLAQEEPLLGRAVQEWDLELLD